MLHLTVYACKWSAGLKVGNFQKRTEPIRLLNILNFPSIVADELAVLQQRTSVGLPLKLALHLHFIGSSFLVFLKFIYKFSQQSYPF